MTKSIEIKRVETSKISSVDFDNLPFGSVYSAQRSYSLNVPKVVEHGLEAHVTRLPAGVGWVRS